MGVSARVATRYGEVVQSVWRAVIGKFDEFEVRQWIGKKKLKEPRPRHAKQPSLFDMTTADDSSDDLLNIGSGQGTGHRAQRLHAMPCMPANETGPEMTRTSLVSDSTPGEAVAATGVATLASALRAVK